MSLSNTWKLHFQTLLSSTDVNKNLKSFARDSSSTDLNDFTSDILRNFTQDKNSIILVKAPATNRLAMYHSITNIGGTRARPDDKLVCLLGSSLDASAVMFDKESVTTNLSIKCPTHNNLKAVVKTTTVPTRNRHTFLNQKKSFPPMISDPFLEITDKDPFQLLFELNAIISALSKHSMMSLSS